MEAVKQEATRVCHVVAMPYPGRGHVNPMMNLCKQLSSRKPDILITFVLTEEWHGFVGSDTKPDNIRFRTLPNVIPSELGRALDFKGFLEAVFTKLETPFEKLLDQLQPPVTAIAADTHLPWVVGIGNRRNIPVVSLWTMSATVLSVFLHFDRLVHNRHFPVESTSDPGNEVVDYIPGVPPTRLTDLPTIFFEQELLDRALECMPSLFRASYLLLTSVYELESQVINTLRAKFDFPVYPVGPSIPYSALTDDEPPATTGLINGIHYLQWLDSQPKGSVLYVSLGSFLSVSNTQMDEILAGVRDSGVRYLWVARGDDASRFKAELCDANRRGVVVPWCDQLRVLSHSSVGGFWSHCGWNSTLEAAYSGVPVLTFPILWDQNPNSKQIVEDWKTGWRAKKPVFGSEALVTREEIAELVRRFMDSDNDEVMKMRKRARELREICRGAIDKGGSSDANLEAFIRDISSRAHARRVD